MIKIKDQITTRIKSNKKGWVFCAKDFYDLANRNTIDKNIARLVDDKIINKIDWGLYYYPILQDNIGLIPPNVTDVAIAVSRSLGVKILPSGAVCVNILGLSNQVPAQNRYLTNGRSFKKNIAGFDIIFKHSKIVNIIHNNNKAGLVLNALNYLGKDNINNDILKKCSSLMNKVDKQDLLKMAQNLSVWIMDVSRKLNSI